MPAVDFAEFTELPFPDHGDIVYVLGFKRPGAYQFTAFYVGESTRSIGRFGDYLTANFTAPTDFKVGKAVQRFRELGYQVVIRYKVTSDRYAEEQRLIEELRRDGPLLNDHHGYKYTEANEMEELNRVLEFVKRCLKGLTSRI